jgi:hypothetical protein
MHIPFFTILSGLNGYNSLSNEVYYPLAATSGLITYWRTYERYDKLPLDKKLRYSPPGRFAITVLATGMSMGLSGIAGHYMGRAIREVVDSGRRPPAAGGAAVISCSEIPSSPHIVA